MMSTDFKHSAGSIQTTEPVKYNGIKLNKRNSAVNFKDIASSADQRSNHSSEEHDEYHDQENQPKEPDSARRSITGMGYERNGSSSFLNRKKAISMKQPKQFQGSSRTARESFGGKKLETAGP